MTRLAQARIAAGYTTALQFSDSHGIPQSTYSMHESGKRALKKEVAEHYTSLINRTPGVNCTVGWLLTGEGAEPVPRATLAGTVGAGERVEPSPDEDHLEQIDGPPGLSAPAVAVRVRGDSMLPAYQNGDTLFYEWTEKGVVPDRAIGRDCVVQLKGGDMLLKKMLRGSRPGLYHLISYNPAMAPLQDQAVLWASPVLWVQRA